jgi:RHS repeat-associated protein
MPPGIPSPPNRYDAWGNPQGLGNIATGIWAQATSLIDASLAADIASRQVLRYAGYSYDSESGLYYLSARYYDLRTGQFLTKDPARSDGEASGYQYCGGNPVGYVDPAGISKTLPPALSENGHGQWRLRPAPRNTLAGGLRFLYEAYQAGEISEEEWTLVLGMQNAIVENPVVLSCLEAYVSDSEIVGGLSAQGAVVKQIEWDKAMTDPQYLNRVLQRNAGCALATLVRNVYKNKGGIAAIVLSTIAGIPLGQAETEIWYAKMVASNGLWDWKTHAPKGSIFMWTDPITEAQWRISAETFGNISSGYIGSVLGISLTDLCYGSALVQNGYDVGNERRDQQEITYGVSLNYISTVQYRTLNTGVYFVRVP